PQRVPVVASLPIQPGIALLPGLGVSFLLPVGVVLLQRPFVSSLPLLFVSRPALRRDDARVQVRPALTLLLRSEVDRQKQQIALFPAALIFSRVARRGPQTLARCPSTPVSQKLCGLPPNARGFH